MKCQGYENDNTPCTRQATVRIHWGLRRLNLCRSHFRQARMIARQTGKARLLALVLPLAGCGAEGFYSIPIPDGGIVSDVSSDAGTDANFDVSIDAGADASSDTAIDSAPCTAFSPDAGTKCGGGWATQVWIDYPVHYCQFNSSSGNGSAGTTPPACRCQETFTCACLTANLTGSQLCAGSGSFFGGCFTDMGKPFVQCQ